MFKFFNIHQLTIVGKKLIFEGCAYLKSRERNGKTYWAVRVINIDEVIIFRGLILQSSTNREYLYTQSRSYLWPTKTNKYFALNFETFLYMFCQLPEHQNLANEGQWGNRRKDVPPNLKPLAYLEDVPEVSINTYFVRRKISYSWPWD